MTTFEVGKFYKCDNIKYECLAIIEGSPVFINRVVRNPKPFVSMCPERFSPWPKEKVKKERWINVWDCGGRVYVTASPWCSEEIAKEKATNIVRTGGKILNTIRIEWEEEVEE